MIIEIAAPVFKCVDDEQIFLSRLAEIDGCQKIVEKGSSITLTVRSDSEELVEQAIGDICSMWHTTFSVS